MAGQEQINQYNQQTLFDKYNKKLQSQVKNWYMQEHFAVKTEYNETETLYNYLMLDVYSTRKCELQKFIDKDLQDQEKITNNYFHFENKCN